MDVPADFVGGPNVLHVRPVPSLKLTLLLNITRKGESAGKIAASDGCLDTT